MEKILHTLAEWPDGNEYGSFFLINTLSFPFGLCFLKMIFKVKTMIPVIIAVNRISKIIFDVKSLQIK